MITKADIESLEKQVCIELDETEYGLTVFRLSKLISSASKLKLIDTTNVMPTLGSIDNVYDDTQTQESVSMFVNTDRND